MFSKFKGRGPQKIFLGLRPRTPVPFGGFAPPHTSCGGFATTCPWHPSDLHLDAPLKRIRQGSVISLYSEIHEDDNDLIPFILETKYDSRVQRLDNYSKARALLSISTSQLATTVCAFKFHLKLCSLCSFEKSMQQTFGFLYYQR